MTHIMIYGQKYLFALGSLIGLCPRELSQAKVFPLQPGLSYKQRCDSLIHSLTNYEKLVRDYNSKNPIEIRVLGHNQPGIMKSI